jgi:hypothetical protein
MTTTEAYLAWLKQLDRELDKNLLSVALVKEVLPNWVLSNLFKDGLTVQQAAIELNAAYISLYTEK